MNKALLKRYRILLGKAIQKIFAYAPGKAKIGASAKGNENKIQSLLIQTKSRHDSMGEASQQGQSGGMLMHGGMKNDAVGKEEKIKKNEMQSTMNLIAGALAQIEKNFCLAEFKEAEKSAALTNVEKTKAGAGEVAGKTNHNAAARKSGAKKAAAKKNIIIQTLALAVSYSVKYTVTMFVTDAEGSGGTHKAKTSPSAGAAAERAETASQINKSRALDGTGGEKIEVDGKSQPLGVGNVNIEIAFAGETKNNANGSEREKNKILIDAENATIEKAEAETKEMTLRQYVSETKMETTAAAFTKMVVTTAKINEKILELKNASEKEKELILRGTEIKDGYLCLERDGEK